MNIVELRSKRKSKLAEAKVKLELECLSDPECDVDVDVEDEAALGAQIHAIRDKIKIRKKSGTDNS
jgi:hypothetical protein